jgi:hypothetical protein
MPKAPHPSDLRDAQVLAEATLWTAFVQVAPGDRRRAEFPTRSAAETHASEAAIRLKRPIMVYGVNAAGRSALASVFNHRRA